MNSDEKIEQFKINVQEKYKICWKKNFDEEFKFLK